MSPIAELPMLHVVTTALALVHLTTQVIVYGMCRVAYPLVQVSVRAPGACPADSPVSHPRLAVSECRVRERECQLFAIGQLCVHACFAVAPTGPRVLATPAQ